MLSQNEFLMKLPYLLLFTILLFSSISCSDAKDKQAPKITRDYNKSPFSRSDLATYQAIFDQTMAKFNLNGAVIVSVDGYPIYKYTKGYADIIKRVPIDSETIFQIASVSKMFTATCIMQLQERGQLEYDAPVFFYIPEFPYKTITIRHLLQHTSGLINYAYSMDRIWPKDKLMSNNDLLNYLVKSRPALVNKPGARFIYSNTGYAVLACVVSRIAKQPFEQYLDDHIFKVLGMSHTSTLINVKAEDKPHMALGYYDKTRRARVFPIDKFTTVLGDKSICTTIDDILLWHRGLVDGSLLSKESLQQAWEPCRKNNNEQIGYGFGFRMPKMDGRDYIYHNGNWNGFVSSFAYRPDNKLCVTILCNTRERVGNMARSLVMRYEQHHGQWRGGTDVPSFD